MKPTTVKVGGGVRCLYAYLRDWKVYLQKVYSIKLYNIQRICTLEYVYLQKYSVCIKYCGGGDVYLQASLISIFTAHKRHCMGTLTHSVVSDRGGDVSGL